MQLQRMVWMAVFAGIACKADPLIFVTPEGRLLAYETSTRDAPASSFEGFAPDEEAKLRGALAATWDVIRLDEFQNRVAAVANLHVSSGGDVIAGPRFLELYFTRRLPVHYVKVDTHGATAETGTQGEHALTRLDRENLARWPADTGKDAKLRRACLINTLAHEWTHAVPDDAGEVRFADRGHQCSTSPLVSYVTGAVAQCVYLQREKVIKPEALWKCVDAVGTKVFNGGTVCESSAWLSSL